MNDKLHRPMHEEDPFLPAEEQDLFLPAEEQDLPSPVQEGSSPEPVSRPPKAKGRLSHSPKASGSGAVQATGSRQPTSTPQPASTRLSQLATPTPKLRATAGPTSLTAGALILLNPGVVRQGSQVSVTGTGFTPKATIDLVLKRQAQDLSLSATVVQADKSGSFGGASLPVPTSLSAGTFLVQAHERGSQQVAQAVGTIAGGTPQVKLSAQGAQPGEMIVFSLHGFSPGEAINIYWNSMGGQPVATVHADGAGAVSQASVQVPFGAVGPNTFLFVGSTSQALTAATIQLLALSPTVTLSSYAIQADNTLSFTGKGVGPGERVLVYLNNPNDAPVAVLQSNAQGAFSKAGNFLIPFSLKGKQTLVFQGEQSQTPSLVSCTVEPYTPGIQPSTYGGFPGTTVSFYATGFARNEVVHVYVGATQNRAGTLVSCFRTDDPGNAGAGGSYVIPGTAQVGKLVFKLIGSKSGGSAPPPCKWPPPRPRCRCRPSPPSPARWTQRPQPAQAAAREKATAERRVLLMKKNMYLKAQQRAALAQEVLMNGENGYRESVVIIPTYNEALNLELLVPSILCQGRFDILIIDDNSPDGTGAVAEKFARRFPGRVSVRHRAGKLGLASAYLAGFDDVLAQGYQQVFTMDADFSHDPSRLPALQAALAEADVVLGSRYVSGGGTRRWPLRRRLLSQGGSAYAGLVLGLPIRDLTGGFKGFRRQVLEALRPELASMRAHGYAFQIEMTYRCARQGWRIVEVPILFEDRLVGTSTMRRGIVAEALWLVWALRLSQGAAPLHPDARPRARLARRRMMTAAMALVFLLLFLGMVNIAPKRLSHLMQGGSVPLASLSHMRPTSSTGRRSIPSPRAARVTARTQTASLQLQGTDLTPNVPLSFVGSGFLPGEALVATIEDTQRHPEAQLAPLSADQAGRVNTIAQTLLPTLMPGTHLLLVKREQSQRTAQATFQLHWIPPTVELDTHSVKPKHDVGFSGSGFLPNEVVEVRLGSSVSEPVVTVSANAGGNVWGHFTVPLMPEGDYQLFLVGLQSQTPTSVGLNVQGFYPWVVLDTYAPSPHARIGFEGRDFAPGEEVLVYLNKREGKPVARLYADTTGRFVAQAAWEVGELSGENALIFVGQQSGAVVTTSFTLSP